MSPRKKSDNAKRNRFELRLNDEMNNILEECSDKQGNPNGKIRVRQKIKANGHFGERRLLLSVTFPTGNAKSSIAFSFGKIKSQKE